jgi:hypothetical protein
MARRVKGNGWVRFRWSIKRDTKIQTVVVASPAKQIFVRAVVFLFDCRRETRGSTANGSRVVRESNTPPRSRRRSCESGSRSAGWLWSRRCRKAINKFEVEFLE